MVIDFTVDELQRPSRPRATIPTSRAILWTSTVIRAQEFQPSARHVDTNRQHHPSELLHTVILLVLIIVY